MERRVVIIEMGKDGYFSCYMQEDYETFGLAGYGETVEKAKEDFWNSYEETKEIEESEGRVMPVFKAEYKYDIQSFFDYFDFFNVSKIAEMAGINPSLMRQYSKGITKAGEKQYKKLSKVVSTISEELSEVTF